MAEIIEVDSIDEISFVKVKKTRLASSHYVDNKKLSDIMVEWRKKCDEAKAAGLERPRIPEYVGEAILKIAISLGKRFNFRGYSYLDEMISDAVLHVCKYIHNFNPFAATVSGVPSAFSYINRIIWRSFTHRIELEDRNQYLKNKSFELLGGMDAFKDSDLNDIFEDGSETNSNGGATMSVIGDELLNRAYEYEIKHGLGPKRFEEKEPTEVEDDFMFNLEAA